jgi:DNA-binding HxlR family transcriptional regulator
MAPGAPRVVEAAEAVDAAPATCGTDGTFCPRFHHAVELIGRRWTGVVLRAMLRGATRYSDIRAAVPALSDKMLAERLKELEAEGVLTRAVVPSTPVRVEYHLTAKGRALDAALAGLAAWAAEWVEGPPEAAESA